MLAGSINHIAITVVDLDDSMIFYKPFLALLGYDFKANIPSNNDVEDSYFGCSLFGNDDVGTWINLWQKSPASDVKFDRYNVGLHHMAFHVETKDELFKMYSWVKDNKNCTILDAPKDYPEYGPNYCSFFFTELNGIKLEIVTMEPLGDAGST